MADMIEMKTLTIDGVTYRVVDENALPKSGGTLTGDLTLAANPTADNHAANKEYVDRLGLPAVTTAGSGSAYTATVPGVSALTAGASFIMIPHTASNTKTPTLNVNGLGAKSIKRHTSNVSSTLANGYADSWLSAGTPVEVIYNGTYWIVQGMTQTNPHDLSTAVPVAKGGTGYTSIEDTTYTTARYRASALVDAETNPTTNGVINWTYE